MQSLTHRTKTAKIMHIEVMAMCCDIFCCFCCELMTVILTHLFKLLFFARIIIRDGAICHDTI